MFRLINPIRLNSKSIRYYTTSNSEPLVLLENHLVDGKYTGIKILKLNKPKALNALSFEMGEDFKKSVASLENDKSLKCLVLTGADKAFSAGGDLNFLMDRARDQPINNQIIMEKFYRTFLCIRNIPVPIISAINGHAIGAGFCLALATDIRVSSNKAQLGLTFTSLGIHPGMGCTHFLPRIAGSQVSSRMILTADVVLGDEAKQLGLVAESVDPDQVLPVALKIAEKISNNSAISVQTATRTLRNMQDVGLETSLTREASAQSQCYAHPDILEGIAAIKEKRKPNHNELLK
ncbi:hypothetical protein DICPUDRAFT_57755 [Dictyostelium purpureum]|uniref:Enoyl-CoA hydratase n=1 Tax=Dictyostelium purpureum TaxID=5786 RepID=F0ZXH1_DICPU|nr:uncharacterized protein DICPUDRAFT_57755 [Dictyostelium purpureum]EGC31362.1 hypothetical protein DICPUDRAFT_57755 [Dictyostelium purpureum]|eukprot:XP_003292110.1 hypothetical protein DICPUDRAFT_57755 [Dictyostelium purpureum]